MHKHSFGLLVFALATTVGLCRAYMIDEATCTGDTRDWLKKQIDCAFNVIEAAVNALNDNSRDESITKLLDILIATSDDNTYVTPAQAVLARFDGVSPGNNPAGMRFGYPGILSMREEKTDNLQADDVKFYCSTDRFEKVKDSAGNDRFRDNEFEELLPFDQGDPRKACDGATMAFTYVPEDTTRWSTITMCPWFLNYARELKFPECGTFGDKFKGLSAKALDEPVRIILGYTKMDIYSLFDKVIIHELTHTRSGGETWDSLMDPNGGEGLKNTAYGFKNCKEIRARHAVVGDSVLPNTPQNNADTFALFASGVRLINAGGAVDENGKVTKPTNQKRWPLVAIEFEA
ncbi:MAG: hypothetical protein M1817_004093 [Caeruleum heppii]|nr:MAG: hypothetical protein M1817_004093 [Caeruleum heppii]